MDAAGADPARHRIEPWPEPCEPGRRTLCRRVEEVLSVPAYDAVAHGRVVFNAAYVAWGLSEAWIFARDRVKVAGHRADRGSLLLLIPAIMLAMAGALASAEIPGTAIALPPMLLLGAGTALMLAGIAFRLWAVRSLGRFFRVSVTTHDDHRIIDRGPYRLLRHPSYTGVIATLAGFGIAIGHWSSLPAALLPPLAAFGWRIRVEEASLSARFGASYDAFRARRWAIIPFVW